MEPKGISLGRCNNGKTGDGFVDRSKVRILLCDNNSNGSQEVFTLLCRCSYQVISVKSPRQVIDALNAEGPNIDIILSEVDLPMAKGLKMLKYIMRKELRRIPVIMMSAQDEVTLVVKCLTLGAADYLVKPLRTNELLNLWTHVWRRRRMLGLAEKKMMNYEFDLVPSDPSDANTNGTMFSDDTDEKSRKSDNPEISVSIHRGDEINVLLASRPMDTQLVSLSNDQSNLLHQQGQIMSAPKKSELKIGKSSAFFTYVKSTLSKKTMNEATPPISRTHKEPSFPLSQRDESVGDTRGFLDSQPLDESSTPSLGCKEFPEGQMQQSYPDVSGFNLHSSYPYYLHGAMNMMTPSSLGDPRSHVPHYPHRHVPEMASFPYYPANLGQVPPTMVHPWPSPSGRREAALLKFRQKRKERCFDKKIRYVNRKKLAEKRPRVRGQFVRKVNGINVDLNGHPTCNDYDDEDDDEEED